MQIRLTVLAARGGRTTGAPRDVLVGAPAGTVLSAISDGLAAAVAGTAGGGSGTGERERGTEQVSVYAGTERLDPHRQLVGSPPLIDGAEITLYGPSPTAPADPYGPARARLHVIAGPDAGGVHLLHGGRVSLGRSADADVPLDDPDVSRLHCAVTVTDTGETAVTDLDSTNGTTIDLTTVPGRRPVALQPGAIVRLGESAVRVERADGAARPPALATVPDEEGFLRLAPPPPAAAREGADCPTGGEGPPADAPSPEPGAPAPPAGPGRHTVRGSGPMHAAASGAARQEPDHARGLGGWARRLTSRRADPLQGTGGTDDGTRGTPAGAGRHSAADDVRHPDPATVLLTALGPGPRLWERGPEHPRALTVRFGLAHRSDGPGEPVTLDLRECGSLGLAGPRARLAALARSVTAQLTALHGPSMLEVALIAADGSRPPQERTAEWGWLGRLPHVRPAHGQDCRLLLAYDREQAAARAAELIRRLEEAVPDASGTYTGLRTLLVVDGDPGPGPVRDAVARLAATGGAAGVHVLCLAETPPATPASPFDATVGTARAVCPPFGSCGATALLSGEVATAVRIARPHRHHTDSPVATLDGVSAAWAERFSRALAPLREAGAAPGTAQVAPRAAVPLPAASRLLDELGLSRATPSALASRWASAGTHPGRAPLVLGTGPRGPVEIALTPEHGHLLVTGGARAGKTELLRTVAASLAAGTSPDRLVLRLVDGDGTAFAGQAASGGLAGCEDLRHVESRLIASDPGRMRDFAQALTSELKRRTELRNRPRRSSPASPSQSGEAARVVSPRRPADGGSPGSDAPPPRLPRMVVVVDDLDALVDPALGSPGRPAAPSVVRALEGVARDGARLGVHLVAASGHADRTAGTDLARLAAYHVRLAGHAGEDAVPGRGTLHLPDGTATPLQAGRVTGRIPRTATLRPTVVPLDWTRAGDPPTRRQVRELGNGPTDLALLASAVDRAARAARGAGAERRTAEAADGSRLSTT
ncbi:FHA domain-containing protein [Streptomyces sp. TR06-5]|uniref:FHA domain-containing protein n=1 Tax=Streptomyces sp. TR06-5 TaxID=3385976 RepID=UPI00399FF4C3